MARGALLCAALWGSTATAGAHADATARPASPSALRFEPNRGQFSSAVDFLARGGRYAVALSRGGMVLSVTDGDARQRPLRLTPIGANADASAFGDDPFDMRSHYLRGGGAAALSDVPSFARAGYRAIYPGIDLVSYGKDGELEFDFVVAPAADPAAIGLKVDGVDALWVDARGDLHMRVGARDVVQHAPVAYQLDDDGARLPRAARFALRGDVVGFRLGDYDRTRALVIDPVIGYASYFGGSGDDRIAAVKTDAAGNVYLIGLTQSADLPTVAAYDATYSSERVAVTTYNFCSGCADGDGQVARTAYERGAELFVTKLNPAGTAIVYSTYIGTNFTGELLANEVAVSSAGEVFFALPQNGLPGGELPLVNATASSGAGWAARLNAAGSGFVYASYYPYDFLRGVAVDSNNRLVAGSSPTSTLWAAVNPIPGQTCHASGGDMAAIRLAANGTVDFASCLGGSGRDYVRAVTVDASDNIYLFGRTRSADFPAQNPLPGAPSNTSYSLAIVRLDATSRAITFSTRFFSEGNAPAYAGAIAVDGSGHIVVAGYTGSSALPVKNAFQPNRALPSASYLQDSYGACPFGYLAVQCEDWDYVLASIDPAAPAVVYATYFGGTASESAIPNLVIDGAGYAVIAGGTRSTDLPVRVPVQASSGGKQDQFVARFSPAGRLNFATYLGGSGDDASSSSVGLASAPDGTIWVAGSTNSANFPTAGGALHASPLGGADGTLVGLTLSSLTDTDGDGVPDAADAFPNDPGEWANHDGDPMGDNADPDDDGDGVADAADAFPFDPAEHLDSDGDGKGDVADAFPTDPFEQYDTNHNGTGDNADPDADSDGVTYDPFANAPLDRFPLDPAESKDTDGDGIGDNADADRDGDGLANASDDAPLDADVPVITFTTFSVFNTNTFKRPLPAAFNPIYAWPLTWTEALDSSPAGAGVGVALTSPATADGQTSGVGLRSCRTTQISFDARVSSASGDQLQFWADGSLLLTLQGEQAWGPHSFTLPRAVHDLRWLYAKNASGSAGLDAAWIDNVDLHQPPSCIFDAGFD